MRKPLTPPSAKCLRVFLQRPGTLDRKQALDIRILTVETEAENPASYFEKT